MNIEVFIKYLSYEKRYSEHTIKSYETDLIQFRNFVLSESESKNLDKALIPDFNLIRKWMINLNNSGCTSVTINRKLSSIKSYIRFLKKEGIVFKDPFEKIISPKNKRRLPEFIQMAQMNKLDSIEFFSNDFSGLRDKFIIEMFYNTGMRLSELIELKHGDINLSGENVKVFGKRKKERIIPLNFYTINIYNKYCQLKNESGFSVDKNSYLFVTDKGNKMYGNFVYRKIVYYLGLVTGIDKKSPHVLRHTFATHMLNNGADLNVIKELLGHAGLAATQIYTHNSFEKIKNIYKRAHPRA
ncbi:MAG: tyrosine-type recombinase/integrase [Bacteroidales bacterium]|nr:tyrosine-type recombinase/integrase [Bacteroidales bacterium]